MYKAVRESLGLSKAEFGRLLGFGSPYVRVNELENGTQQGSPQLQRFVMFLNYLVVIGEKETILKWYNEL